ncbi:3'(2'),5'-bisphosphate nucleotidase CysQ [Aquimarina sp. M1]
MKRIELLNTAIRAAILAGEEILKIYQEDFKVEVKEDKSPLTEADKRSNDTINQILKPLDLPLVSEENKEIAYAQRKDWDVCWIVDPLDGTKEFIKRNGEFTVNIALIEKGEPKLGVIYVPVTKELYYADVTSKKAFKSIVNYKDLSSYKFFEDVDLINWKENNKDLIKVVGSRSHMNQDTLDFVESLKEKYEKVDIVSKGSSLKFCLVAEGKADVYPRFAPTMEWDTAAGQAICEATGLKVLDMKTKKTMTYNRENMLNNYFLVTK